MRTSFIAGAVILFALLASAPPVKGEVSVHIGINAPPPPAYVIPAPPPVVVIPGTYVYFAPGLGVDILFYHGYWYRPHGGYWYMARSYNGPWGFVAPERVPHALVALPPEYRHLPPGQRHIPYGQLKKNWGRWEREHRWERAAARDAAARDEWERRDHGPGGGHERDHRDWGGRDDRGWGHGHGGHGGR